MLFEGHNAVRALQKDLPPHLAGCIAEAGADLHNTGSRQASAKLPISQIAFIEIPSSLVTHWWKSVKAGLGPRLSNNDNPAAAL